MLRGVQQQIKLRLGSTNPYKIRDEFKILTSTTPQSQLTFKERLELNEDQSILRFLLPDNNKCLGHLIGQHVMLELDGIQKPYVPISSIDQPGVADFMVKKVQKPNMSQSLSHKLLHLNEGDKVKVKGPITQFIYEGYGQFIINDIAKKYRYVGMIAHSTAFLTCYTLAQRIATFPDTTSLSFLWTHQHEEDIVMLNQFNDFVERKKLNLNLMIQNYDKDWLGPAGQITKQHIKKYMPPPREDTLLLIFGYKSFVGKTKEICEQLGHKNILI